MYRKTFAILLLISLTAPMACIYCWLSYRKSVVRHEVKEKLLAGINRDDLVLIRFSENHSGPFPEWKHSGEFRYNGQMYDVVESDTVGDTIYYWCWPDTEETAVDQQLSELTARALKTDPLRTKNQNRLTNFFKILYFRDNPELQFTDNLSDLKLEVFYSIRYKSINISPPNPPPRLN